MQTDILVTFECVLFLILRFFDNDFLQEPAIVLSSAAVADQYALEVQKTHSFELEHFNLQFCRIISCDYSEQILHKLQLAKLE